MLAPSWCRSGLIPSGEKYLSQHTEVVWGYLYLTIYILDNFYFTTLLKTIMYFSLHTLSLTPKSTRYILNAKQDRKMVQFTHLSREHPSLVIPIAFDLADSLNTNA